MFSLPGECKSQLILAHRNNLLKSDFGGYPKFDPHIGEPVFPGVTASDP